MVTQQIQQKVKEENRYGVTGKLIVVEGIDGSGKSTQIRLLEKWLRFRNIRVFLTEWNSSEAIKDVTAKGKKKEKLTPTTFSLLHATDFADRYERNIFPLLRAGYIVLDDTYNIEQQQQLVRDKFDEIVMKTKSDNNNRGQKNDE